MKRGAYYNEIDPYCVQWLRNLIAKGLIADGDVDSRDIRLVQPEDLRGYRQAHFFAGIGGWSHALRLAQWPDDVEVWTGSCPCQPFSHAGKRLGTADPRHLWPEFFRLIAGCEPSIVFGEQVASAHQWLRGVRSDLEAVEYSVGAMPIEAASIGARHKRDRYWFVAHANRQGEHVVAVDAEMGLASQPLANTHGLAWHQGRTGNAAKVSRGRNLNRGGVGGNVCDANGEGLEVGKSKRGDTCSQQPASIRADWWSVEPSMGRVAHGVSARVGKLRALGNAIVPQVAAEFIAASREAIIGA